MSHVRTKFQAENKHHQTSDKKKQIHVQLIIAQISYVFDCSNFVNHQTSQFVSFDSWAFIVIVCDTNLFNGISFHFELLQPIYNIRISSWLRQVQMEIFPKKNHKIHGKRKKNAVEKKNKSFTIVLTISQARKRAEMFNRFLWYYLKVKNHLSENESKSTWFETLDLAILPESPSLETVQKVFYCQKKVSKLCILISIFKVCVSFKQHWLSATKILILL